MTGLPAVMMALAPLTVMMVFVLTVLPPTPAMSVLVVTMLMTLIPVLLVLAP